MQRIQSAVVKWRFCKQSLRNHHSFPDEPTFPKVEPPCFPKYVCRIFTREKDKAESSAITQNFESSLFQTLAENGGEAAVSLDQLLRPAETRAGSPEVSSRSGFRILRGQVKFQAQNHRLHTVPEEYRETHADKQNQRERRRAD